MFRNAFRPQPGEPAATEFLLLVSSRQSAFCDEGYLFGLAVVDIHTKRDSSANGRPRNDTRHKAPLAAPS